MSPPAVFRTAGDSRVSMAATVASMSAIGVPGFSTARVWVDECMLFLSVMEKPGNA
jgi:hypothetical protein